MKVGGAARDSGLALMLDDGTRKSHSVAENTAFVAGFFRGMSSTDAFAKLTAAFYHVYTAMENAFEDETADGVVKQMDFGSLRRKQALERDMEFFFGPDFRDTVKPSPATQRYVDRLNTLRSTSDYRLVAHQYTRYLGDLFGGQMMAGMAKKSLDLDDDKGLAFYDFPLIEDNSRFIETWYNEVNSLDLSEAQKSALVDEANLAFQLNIGVFDELEGSAASAVWKFAAQSFIERLNEANPVVRKMAFMK